MTHGVVQRRIGGEAGEERCLGQRQLARALAEVRPCGLLDPIGAVSEVDRVEVREQDPILRPALLELPRKRRLADLARDRPLVADVGVLDELLRDRGAALDDRLRADVGPERPEDAAAVDPVVLVEAPVLDGDDRLAHDRRDVADVLEEDTALLAAEDGEHGAPVRRVDDAVDLRVLGRGVELRDLARDGANQTERERRPREQHQHGEHGEEAQLTNPAPPPRRLRASAKPQDSNSSPLEAQNRLHLRDSLRSHTGEALSPTRYGRAG